MTWHADLSDDAPIQRCQPRLPPCIFAAMAIAPGDDASRARLAWPHKQLCVFIIQGGVFFAMAAKSSPAGAANDLAL